MAEGREETMKYKAVIFDLDGTILNTLEDLKCSLNYALRGCGFPELTLEQVRRFLGNGIVNLVERSTPSGTSEEARLQVVERFNGHYEEHCNDNTRPYDGILHTLRALRAAGLLTAVVSNKPDYGVQTLIQQNFPGLFDYVTGVKEGIRRKPAPDSVLNALKALDCQVCQAVYIGDSEVDIETAANAGMDCISVDWGFRDRQQLLDAGAACIITRPEQLETLLLRKSFLC